MNDLKDSKQVFWCAFNVLQCHLLPNKNSQVCIPARSKNAFPHKSSKFMQDCDLGPVVPVFHQSLLFNTLPEIPKKLISKQNKNLIIQISIVTKFTSKNPTQMNIVANLYKSSSIIENPPGLVTWTPCPAKSVSSTRDQPRTTTSYR